MMTNIIIIPDTRFMNIWAAIVHLPWFTSFIIINILSLSGSLLLFVLSKMSFSYLFGFSSDKSRGNILTRNKKSWHSKKKKTNSADNSLCVDNMIFTRKYELQIYANVSGTKRQRRSPNIKKHFSSEMTIGC